jgi:uncharacterized protein
LNDNLTLSSLPLFPLGTVLFPKGFLPLRIFELRYLDMMAKCHRAEAPFGVVSLTQGQEVRRPGAPPEAFSQIGTLATIAGIDRPQPGLMLARCRGHQRFRIHRSEQLKNGLWLADVERIPEDPVVAVPEDLQGVAQALRQVLETLQSRQTGNEPPPAETPFEFDNCGWVANRWCELLPLPAAIRQRLMELDNPVVRLELMDDFLTRAGIQH